MERLELPGGFFLSSVEHGDADALVEHLKERAISRNTKSIPYPYTASDAEAWIERRVEHTHAQPVEVTFAIRTEEERLIGVVGAGDFEVGTSHRTNVGYWLAKPYWNRGITTNALSRFVQFAFAKLQVIRLTAEVFDWNEASARVLEKVGFVQEGRLRKHRNKDGTLVDIRYFGLLKSEFEADA